VVNLAGRSAVGLAAVFGAVLASPQQAPFRATARVVAIYATVHDGDGRLVTDLDRDRFQVFDNGRPVPITAFSNDIVPVTVALLLDMSATMMPQYFRVREAASHFVDVLLPTDRVRIGTMADEVSLSPLLTADHSVLKRILAEELWPGNSTPLWSGIKAGMDSLSGEAGRRVVLVLTDGDDFCELSIQKVRDLGPIQQQRSDAQHRSGCVSAEAVQTQATAEGFMIYAIGMEGPGLSAAIGHLTEATGGGHFDLASDADVSGTFETVVNELHHQYALGISPALDGKLHTLEVRALGAGFVARARKTYQAPRQ